MKNEKSPVSVDLTLSHENYARCLRTLEGYGENHWWLSDDPQRRACYQTEEMGKTRLLLLPNLESYQRDLYALLHRPVSGSELTESGQKPLLQEARDMLSPIVKTKINQL